MNSAGYVGPTAELVVKLQRYSSGKCKIRS